MSFSPYGGYYQNRRPSHYRRNRRNYHIGAILLALFVVLVVGGCNYEVYIKEGTTTFTVQRLDDQATSKGHQYLVFTNKGVYQDSDNLWHGKFASSDLWGALQVGQTYTCKYTGFRIPLFSRYRNLISCTQSRDTRR